MESIDPLKELLAVDHRRALEFFVMNLKDVSEPSVDQQELLYNASLLAHYAQVQINQDDPFCCPRNLVDVFDNFVLDSTRTQDALTMETAGAQCLLLSGFFEEQMKRRHNIHWFAELGSSFFKQASEIEKSPSKAKLLYTLGKQFEPWRRRQARLSQEFRDQPYIIAIPPPAR